MTRLHKTEMDQLCYPSSHERIILLNPAPDGILLRTAAFRESAADLLSGFASSSSEDDPLPGGAKRPVICF
jgi:hypothetical protein